MANIDPYGPEPPVSREVRMERAIGRALAACPNCVAGICNADAHLWLREAAAYEEGGSPCPYCGRSGVELSGPPMRRACANCVGQTPESLAIVEHGRLVAEALLMLGREAFRAFGAIGHAATVGLQAAAAAPAPTMAAMASAPPASLSEQLAQLAGQPELPDTGEVEPPAGYKWHTCGKRSIRVALRLGNFCATCLK